MFDRACAEFQRGGAQTIGLAIGHMQPRFEAFTLPAHDSLLHEFLSSTAFRSKAAHVLCDIPWKEMIIHPAVESSTTVSEWLVEASRQGITPSVRIPTMGQESADLISELGDRDGGSLTPTATQDGAQGQLTRAAEESPPLATLESIASALSGMQKTIEKQGSTIETLLQKNEEQDTTIQEQGSTIKTLLQKNEEQDKTIQEQGSTIKTLRTDAKKSKTKIQQQGLKIDQQGLKIKQQGLKIQHQDSKIERQDSTIRTLRAKVKQQDSKIQTLQGKIEKQNANIKKRDARSKEVATQHNQAMQELRIALAESASEAAYYFKHHDHGIVLNRRAIVEVARNDVISRYKSKLVEEIPLPKLLGYIQSDTSTTRLDRWIVEEYSKVSSLLHGVLCMDCCYEVPADPSIPESDKIMYRKLLELYGGWPAREQD